MLSGDDLNQIAVKRNKHMIQYHLDRFCPNEGWDEFVVIPEIRLQELRDMLDRKHVLLRGPPSCGKTTMAYTFAKYLELQNIDVFWVTCLEVNTMNIDTIFKQQTLSTWSEICDWKCKAIVIIDECQLLYDEKYASFWAQVKNLKSIISVFCLSCYGPAAFTYSSPIEITSLYFTFLKINEDSFNKIIEMHSTRSPFLGKITKPIWHMLYIATGGHASLVRKTLDFLSTNLKTFTHDKNPQHLNEKTNDISNEAGRLLTSKDYLSHIYTIRAFQFLKDTSVATFPNVLKDSLYKCNNRLTFYASCDDILIHMVKIGVIQQLQEQNQYGFTAPLVYDAVYNHFINGNSSIDPDSDESFINFLLSVFSRFNPALLRGSTQYLGYETGSVYEDLWQKEFYRCIAEHLSKKYCIFTNAGRELRGFMDLYINGTVNWGFELLREGKGLQAHVDRFHQDGQYQYYVLRKWVVIDFRKSIPSERIVNVCYVVYSKDYTTFTVLYKNTNQDLKLRDHN